MKKINPKIAQHVLFKDWPGLEIRNVKEGRGVFATKDFDGCVPICHYGGQEVQESFAKMLEKTGQSVFLWKFKLVDIPCFLHICQTLKTLEG